MKTLSGKVPSCTRFTASSARIPHFLTDRVFKEAVTRAGSHVTQNLVESLAPLLHSLPAAQISSVHIVPHSTDLSTSSNDIALEYVVGYGGAAQNTPDSLATLLIEVQRRDETYFAARTLAHISARFASTLHRRADAETAARRAACPPKVSGLPGVIREQSAMSKVYASAYPVQLVALCEFLPAQDDSGAWHSVTTTSAASAAKHALHAPLISTYRLISPAPLVPFVRPLSRRSSRRQTPTSTAALDDSPTPLGAATRDLLSMTYIHLPATPDAVADDAAWNAAVSLPEHRDALKSVQLRRWLHLCAHTEVRGRAVHLPPDLEGDPIFEAVAGAAQRALGGGAKGDE